MNVNNQEQKRDVSLRCYDKINTLIYTSEFGSWFQLRKMRKYEHIFSKSIFYELDLLARAEQ